MSTTRKTPKLRFPEFTDDWEQRKLNELAEFNPKCNLPNSFEYVDLESVVGTEMISSRYEIKENAPSRAQRLAKKGDVFYQTVRPYQRNNYLFDKEENNYVFSTGYAQLRPNCNSRYLLNLLQTDSFVNIVLNNCTGTSYPAINSSDLGNIHVTTTKNIREQTKIGEIFYRLDNLITLHQRELDSLKKLKKSLLQKMFPKNGEKIPELRCPEFTGDWEQRKLKEIACKVKNKNKENAISETFTNSAEFGIISQKEFFDHEVASKTNLDSYYIVDIDDFVYNPRISVTAPVGPINRNKLGKAGVMSPLYTVFKTQGVSIDFLEHYFKSTNWHSYMYLNGDSGARSDRFSIKDDVFFDMPIMVPCIKEQMQIGLLFNAISKNITLHQRELDTLKKLKKGLLQNMFV